MRKLIYILVLVLIVSTNTSCITGQMYPKKRVHHTTKISKHKEKSKSSYTKNKKSRKRSCKAYE